MTRGQSGFVSYYTGEVRFSPLVVCSLSGIICCENKESWIKGSYVKAAVTSDAVVVVVVVEVEILLVTVAVPNPNVLDGEAVGEPLSRLAVVVGFNKRRWSVPR